MNFKDKFKEVMKKEFYIFIKEYPANKLSTGCTTICNLPLRHFRDESLPTKGVCGDIDYFFDKEVARIVMDWMNDKGEEAPKDD